MKQYPDKKISDSFLSDKKEEYKLILYNDNYNNIDFVIDSLIEVCHHNKDQATQCAFIAHFKGKSVIKKGSYNILKHMKDALTDRGLNTGIE
jgi:ATP-dependent Clp protease adaptor protein ClpS